MDIDWPYKKRELGDEIVFHCPNNKLTWVDSLEEQVVTCIWHRQTDTMMWWPQDLHDCNSQYQTRLEAPRTASGHAGSLEAESELSINYVSISVSYFNSRAFQVL